MLFDLISNGFSFDLIINLGVRLLIIIFFLPVHEFAHAYTATKLGDPTAKSMGRLTLNPLAHIDPLGSLLTIFAGFGYAKAVPVNIRNFRPEKRKRNMAIVAVAGPISNLIMAVIFAFLYFLIYRFGNLQNGTFMLNLARVCVIAAQCNISLAVFNFIPIPPLDGSRILSLLIPDKYYYKIMQYEKYIMLAIFALIVFGAFDGVITYLSDFIFSRIFNLIGLIFGYSVG